MKRILLIATLFCVNFADSGTAAEKVVITSDSKVEMYTAFF